MVDDLEARALLSRVLAALGVGMIVPGCAVRIGDAADEAVEVESSESSSSESSSSESGTTTESSSTSDSSQTLTDTETSEGPVLDLPPDPCADGQPQWFPIDAEVPSRCLLDEWGDFAEYLCYEPAEGTTCDAPPFAEQCLFADLDCVEITCGPTTIEGACCYVAAGGCPPGRGFLVAGEPVLAARTCDPSWASSPEPEPELAGLDLETRTALANAWANDALAEHASVASFARFSAQLLALAAPPELVAASIRASADEVRHARRCFGLASAYAGTPVGPGPLTLQTCLSFGRLDLQTAAIELAIEGCIVETVSTLLLAAARDRARDPAVHAVLCELVRDEQDHVVLAWQTLAWMLEQRGGELRRELAPLFEHAERWVRCDLPAAHLRRGRPELLRAHGFIDPHERRAIALTVIDQLIVPAARALGIGAPAQVESAAQGAAPAKIHA